MATFHAGRLRHRIDIQYLVQPQDPNTGEMLPQAWVTLAAAVPAEIAPLSAREFMQSQAVQSTVAARIIIRYRADITAAMRCRHDDGHGTVTYYQLAGKPIRDPEQGLQWLTLPCQAGAYDG